MNVMLRPLFETDGFFCSNTACQLHVCADDPNVRFDDPDVRELGNWATLPSGIIVGRAVYNGRYLCDLCGRAEHQEEATPAGIPAAPAKRLHAE